MEEKINILADFSLELIEKDPSRLTEFYKKLLEYCLENPYDDISYILKEISSHKGTLTLLFLNVSIKLTEIQMIKDDKKDLLNNLNYLTDEYHRILEEHQRNVLTKKG